MDPTEGPFLRELPPEDLESFSPFCPTASALAALRFVLFEDHERDPLSDSCCESLASPVLPSSSLLGVWGPWQTHT